MVARLLYFQHVCDGFDTRIILDIGKHNQNLLVLLMDIEFSSSGLTSNKPSGGSPTDRAEYRTYPVFKDFSLDALPSYTMAIASNSTYNLQSSLELNYYDDFLNQSFGITQTLQAPPPLRTTTITDDRINLTFMQTHTKDTNEVNPPALYKDKIKRIFDNWGTSEEDDLVIRIDIKESPGFYRILYDNVLGTWSTQVSSQRQYNGTFTSDRHLILPALGLQVPDFVDFARNCKYEPFLKMYRGSGTLSEIEKQAKESYRYDGGDVVLRTAAFGLKQRKLEICARRRDIVTDKGVVLEGLGDKLPVVAGLLASVRYEGWKTGRRSDC